jgi:hypothetical protein
VHAFEIFVQVAHDEAHTVHVWDELVWELIQIGDIQFPFADILKPVSHYIHFPSSWHLIQFKSHLIHWTESDI